MGAVLDLPANQHSQFGPNVAKKGRIYALKFLTLRPKPSNFCHLFSGKQQKLEIDARGQKKETYKVPLMLEEGICWIRLWWQIYQVFHFQ